MYMPVYVCVRVCACLLVGVCENVWCACICFFVVFFLCMCGILKQPERAGAGRPSGDGHDGQSGGDEVCAD